MPQLPEGFSEKQFASDIGCSGEDISGGLLKMIQQVHPGFKREYYISYDKLSEFRGQYLAKLVSKNAKDVGKLEKDVLYAISHNKILSENLNIEDEGVMTIGQRLADHVAQFGGSWTFVICFFLFIALWISVNAGLFFAKPADPYPFILLNLILSCLAAIQAPIIMMSQNRKEEKDRARSENDFKTNLKAELEIKLLHEKVDHMILHQHKRLLEIQEIQGEYLREIESLVKGLLK